jgi:hypothetical protein
MHDGLYAERENASVRLTRRDSRCLSDNCSIWSRLTVACDGGAIKPNRLTRTEQKMSGQLLPSAGKGDDHSPARLSPAAHRHVTVASIFSPDKRPS